MAVNVKLSTQWTASSHVNVASVATPTVINCYEVQPMKTTYLNSLEFLQKVRKWICRFVSLDFGYFFKQYFKQDHFNKIFGRYRRSYI